MKLRTFLIVQSVLFLSIPLWAADIDVLFDQAARYSSGDSAEALRQIEQGLVESSGNPELRRELETALVRLLSPSATFEANRFACQQLAVYGTEASLPALAELLKRRDVTGIACLALSTHPSTLANKVLREALTASTGADRVQIIVALGSRKDALAVPILAKLARDPDFKTAATAIAALGKIAGREALESLSSLRGLSDPERAYLAVMASLVAADRFVEAGLNATAADIYEDLLGPSQPPKVRRAAFEGLMRTDADGGEKRIEEVLDGQDVLLKPSAIAQIAVLTGPDVSRKFALELPGLDPAVQVLLIEALAKRNDSYARAAIVEQVSADNSDVRRTAIIALADIGDESAVGVLVKTLGAIEDKDERSIIVTTLSSLQGGEVVDESIIASLRKSSVSIRASLIEVLRRRLCTAAVPVLLEDAASTNGDVAEEAFRALGELASSDAVVQLMARLIDLRAPSARSAAETAVAKVLRKVPDPALRSATILALMRQTKKIETRCSLISLLKVCADAKALGAVKTALEDSDSSIRDAALRSLAGWPDAAAWDLLAEVYSDSKVLREQRLALQGLVRLGHIENNSPTDTLVGHYELLLNNVRDDTELKLILSALAGCAHPDALALVLPLRENAQVKAEAEAAIRKIAEAISDKHPEASREALEQLK